MMSAKHNMIARPYAPQTFHVTGIVQMHIGGQWHETIAYEAVRVERCEYARDTALAQCEAYARQLDPQAVVRWHTPELVRVEVAR
jgi:hypothetical protein